MLGTVWRWASSDPPSPPTVLRTCKEAAAAAHGVQQRTVTRARGTLRKRPVPELPGPRGPGGPAQPGGVQGAGQIPPSPTRRPHSRPRTSSHLGTYHAPHPGASFPPLRGPRGPSTPLGHSGSKGSPGSGPQGLGEPSEPLWQTPSWRSSS